MRQVTNIRFVDRKRRQRLHQCQNQRKWWEWEGNDHFGLYMFVRMLYMLLWESPNIFAHTCISKTIHIHRCTHAVLVTRLWVSVRHYTKFGFLYATHANQLLNTFIKYIFFLSYRKYSIIVGFLFSKHACAVSGFVCVCVDRQSCEFECGYVVAKVKGLNALAPAAYNVEPKKDEQKSDMPHSYVFLRYKFGLYYALLLSLSFSLPPCMCFCVGPHKFIFYVAIVRPVLLAGHRPLPLGHSQWPISTKEKKKKKTVHITQQTLSDAGTHPNKHNIG